MAIERVEDIFKGELFLEASPTHQQRILLEKEALAQVIQNIVLLEKGTLPNQPELGVGIENYLFEPITELTQERLTNDIQSQVAKFIPNMYTVKVEIEMSVKELTNTILIAVSIKDSPFQTSVNSDNGDTLIAMVVGKNKRQQKLMHRLIIG